MLAIAIPFYKINFFDECLQSLAAQTDKRFKIYIGDDASPDNVIPLLRNYQEALDITYKRFEKNLGKKDLPSQWERCIEITDNEKWLMILGDDDFLSPNVVKFFYENLPSIDGKSNVVRFATVVRLEEVDQFSLPYEHPLWEEPHKSYYRKFIKKSRSSLSEYIFSRESHKTNKFYSYPLGWHTDDRAWFEFTGGKPIYTINSAIVYIRNSKINISGQDNNLNEKSRATREFLKYIIQRKISLYSKNEKFKFLRAYEDSLMSNGQLNLLKWLSLLFIYVRYFDIYIIKKYLKRIVAFYKNERG